MENYISFLSTTRLDLSEPKPIWFDYEKKKTIGVKSCMHRDEKRLQLAFDYDLGLIDLIKQIPGCRWSATMHCWHIPDNQEFINRLRFLSGSKYKLEFKNTEKEKPDYDKTGDQYFIHITLNSAEGLIYIQMPYEKDKVDSIKRLNGPYWHAGARMWSVICDKENIEGLRDIFRGMGRFIKYEETGLSTKNIRKFKEKAERSLIPKNYLIQLKLENKSERTIEIYTGFVAQFLKDFEGRDLFAISEREFRDYILSHREKFGYSESYQNQMINSLRSFYKIQYKREFEPGILPRPKKGRDLPKILSREDIQRIIEVCRNEKHKMIILMLYGFGLRLNELLEIRVMDFNIERRQLIVIKGKGRKDRVLPIPEVLLPQILRYIKSYVPKQYFIIGQNGEKYSPSSVQSIVKNLAWHAGIKKKVTPHMLRHCYATHMLERGTDLRYIQNLLGHKSSKTTEIYTHVSMYKISTLTNPLDDLKL